MASGVALGVEIPNIEDMDIDPWADFEKIKVSVSGGHHEQDLSDTVYDIETDAGIMPMSDVTNPTWRVRMAGFLSYGTDEDGSEWDGVSIYEGLSFPVNTVPLSTDINLVFSQFAWCYGGQRPSPVISNLPTSKSSFWTGTPGLINGDPNITNFSSYNWDSGYVYYDVKDWEEEQASSFQIMDAKFLFNLGYLKWNGTDNINGMEAFHNSSISGGHLTEVHLIINGKDVGVVPAAITEKQADEWRYYSVSISDSKVDFDEQLIRSVSFRFDISNARMNGGDNHFSGGVGVGLYAPPVSGKSPYPLVSDSARLYTGVSDNAEQTGLLKGILNAITSLPGKIVTAILDGLKSLFIPDADFIVQWKSDFFTMLETKFGFIYQCFQMLGNFFDEFVLQWGSATDYVFKFPTVEFTVQGTTYTVIEEQAVSFDNPAMDIIRPFLGTFVSIIMVLGFVHSMEEMFVAIISGWSYFSYLHRGDGATGEEENNS